MVVTQVAGERAFGYALAVSIPKGNSLESLVQNTKLNSFFRFNPQPGEIMKGILEVEGYFYDFTIKLGTGEIPISDKSRTDLIVSVVGNSKEGVERQINQVLTLFQMCNDENLPHNQLFEDNFRQYYVKDYVGSVKPSRPSLRIIYLSK